MRHKLPDAKVYRGGVTARHIHLEPTHVQIQSSPTGGGVSSSFTLSSKGGGTIFVRFDFGVGSYETVLRAMLENDRKAALVEMSKIVAEDMATLPAREATVRQSARAQIVEAATTRIEQSNGTDEAIATIVRDKLQEIVDNLEQEELSPARK